MIPVSEALTRVLALAPAPQPETVGLDQALGRVLLEAAQSRMTQPPFNSAAMDGYALREADAKDGARLAVIGESAAGHPWQGQPRPGTAIRIFTGAAVPDGYDRVIMQENTQRDGDDIVLTSAGGNAHIRAKGSDFSTGSTLAPGRILNAGDLALLAAMNVAQVRIARAPRVAVLATGDELVPPGGTPKDGQIICSNDIAVAALARQAGAQADRLGIARDNRDDLQEKLLQAAEYDLIVTIGGASVGDHDLVGQVASDMGLDRSFYKIAMRPGKPLMAGKLGRSIMLGLPGNPVSSVVCSMIFMQPLLRAMQGMKAESRIHQARLSHDLPPEGPRQHYLRAQRQPGPDLDLITPFPDQDSARLGLLSQADALMIRPANDPARKAGDIVKYLQIPRGC